MMETRGSHLFEINREHELATHLQELFIREENRIPAFVNLIRESLTQRHLEEHVLSLILFGSNARRDATPSSDVDLLAVVDSERAMDQVTEAMYAAGEVARRRQGIRISPYVLTEKRVRERAKAGDPLLKTVATEGRLLLGDALEGLVA